MKIIHTDERSRKTVKEFLAQHWGSSRIVVSTGTYQCERLDGFIAINDSDEMIGLITYIVLDDYMEVISFDSVYENSGTGTKLLDTLERFAVSLNLRAIQLITTNDNLNALGFYQKRGFQIMDVYPNSVANARKIKPEIPLVAENNIPIRDELLLIKPLHETKGK
ncbi:GNAT family N-acetyltransferase [Pseudalkalibacillus berkeleyi]|uniref:GNAT family N-acetyltransferase n=1 Tax=Pseudalkalibacillus berkeleyi TaxID=1069813 RepID=A0ABS9GUA0_9BACL|nr:GNAT family N-acetyltransferase [Pseudalkalibacillus berkeleyi]MCF6136414.1 GNAT family N-acetyltransferase [Pseudalkalibacillus berkeleyi]